MQGRHEISFKASRYSPPVTPIEYWTKQKVIHHNFFETTAKFEKKLLQKQIIIKYVLPLWLYLPILNSILWELLTLDVLAIYWFHIYWICWFKKKLLIHEEWDACYINCIMFQNLWKTKSMTPWIKDILKIAVLLYSCKISGKLYWNF